MLTNNFSNTVSSFLSKDDAYQFMDTIKGTSVNYKKNFSEVSAMVKWSNS